MRLFIANNFLYMIRLSNHDIILKEIPSSQGYTQWFINGVDTESVWSNSDEFMNILYDWQWKEAQ